MITFEILIKKFG